MKLRLPILRLVTTILSLQIILFIVFTAFLQIGRYTSYGIQKRYISIIDDAQRFDMAIAESQKSLERYLVTANGYQLAEHNKALNEARRILSSLDQLIEEDSEASYLIEAMDWSLWSYSTECALSSEALQSGNESYYLRKQNADLIAAYLTQYSDNLLTLVLGDNIDLLNSDISSYRTMLTINLLFVFFFILSLIFVIYLYSSRIRAPLNALVKQAEEVSEGNFGSRTHLERSDPQVALLSDTFNLMAEDISKMMDDLRKKVDAEEKMLAERAKRIEYEARLDKATFLALQTQTNPHFLYNTLNSINRTIQLGKTESAMAMIKSLSDLMRYNLSDGSIPAILGEEIEITEKYLLIQKMRFSERLAYTIEADGALLDTLMLPRFTLQPLVENAIIHGISPKEEGGNLRIKAYKDGDYGIICISDDGVGMNAERKSEGSHIGLENTRKRLELFEERHGVMWIESSPGKGTSVYIRLRRER